MLAFITCLAGFAALALSQPKHARELLAHRNTPNKRRLCRVSGWALLAVSLATCLAAFAFGALPLLNLLTTDKHLGITLPAGVWELAGFDLTMLAIGLAFAVAAVRSQVSVVRSQGFKSIPSDP